jgi:Leucine-rich repeat (LRR) protein
LKLILTLTFLLCYILILILILFNIFIIFIFIHFFKLRSIDAGAFQGNPALVMLDLSRNELIDLAPATFLSQLNLLLVDLNHNRIIRTPFGAFGRRVATVLLQGK